MSVPLTMQGERQLHAMEIRSLGPEHAREHAIERRALREEARRWKRMTPAQRRESVARAHQRDLRIAQSSVARAGTPAEVGSWTTAPFTIPNYAIHSAVLPTGKILFWGYPPVASNGQRPNGGAAALWDPTKTGSAAFKLVNPPLIDVDGDGTLEAAPIYCSGQSFLATGALLVAGGNLIWPRPANGYSSYAGTRRVFTFNPWTESWTEQPQMAHGRWYPSQVELADGRTAIVSGYSDAAPGGDYNSDFELFNPSGNPSGIGSVERRPSADRSISLYPHLFSLPNEKVALFGPDSSESAILDPVSFTWLNLPPPALDRTKGTGVAVPGGPNGSWTVTQQGGYDLGLPPGPDGVYPATASGETLDTSKAAPAWQTSSSLNVARANQNNVLLPDGSMVTVGGGRGYSDNLGGYETYADGRARQVELWDPATKTWELGPAQLEDRAYHSTAVLLPDGRVMSAGDDYHPSTTGGSGPLDFSPSDTAEIYSPPYLFKGTRPVIGTAPSAIRWGDSFGVLSSSSGLSRAVLMAPSATTHGVDMSQRHVELQVIRNVSGTGVDLVAPPSAGIAPPGYYMLFLLNDQGVPSVASWVRIGADAPDQPLLSEMQTTPPSQIGVTINNGAQFTNNPQVTISAVWPPLAETMLISNDGGFISPGSFPVSPTAPWTLDSSGAERLPKTVYVRFQGAGSDTQTFQDDIVLDQTPPTIQSALLSGGAQAAAARSIAQTAGGGGSRRLQIRATDNASGLGQMQVARRTSVPGAWMPFSPKLRVKGRRVFVRVRDRAGNVSGWRKAKQRRKLAKLRR